MDAAESLNDRRIYNNQLSPREPVGSPDRIMDIFERFKVRKRVFGPFSKKKLGV